MRQTFERVITLNDLVDSIPEEIVNQYLAPPTFGEDSLETFENDSMNEKPVSKSQRVRDFLEDHPDAPAKEVIDALSEYGVTVADVSNVRSKLKQNKDKKKKSAGPAPSAPVSQKAAPAGIGIKALEAGVSFVREAGSIQSARELLLVIEEIRSI